MKKTKCSSSGAVSSFRPYAVAVSTNGPLLSQFKDNHPGINVAEVGPSVMKLANELVHHVRLQCCELDVQCHVFQFGNVNALSFELDMTPDIDCFVIKSASDEDFARRYLAAIRAIRRSQGNLEKTLYFVKPTKQFSRNCPQAAPELAAAREGVLGCIRRLGSQHEDLWQVLKAGLRPLSYFKPFLKASQKSAPSITLRGM